MRNKVGPLLVGLGLISNLVVMGTDSIRASGSNAPHANEPPSPVVNFIIKLEWAASRREPLSVLTLA